MSKHIHRYDEDGFCHCGADMQFDGVVITPPVKTAPSHIALSCASLLLNGTQPTPEQTAGPVGLTIKYPLGHSYAEQWRKADDVRCTKCASAEVWRDCDEPCNPEDSAPLHICVECGHAFEYETGNGYGDLNEQRLAQLRAVSTRVKGE